MILPVSPMPAQMMTKRNQRQRRHRAHEFNDRVKPATEPVGQAHGVSQWYADDGAEEKAEDHAVQ